MNANETIGSEPEDQMLASEVVYENDALTQFPNRRAAINHLSDHWVSRAGLPPKVTCCLLRLDGRKQLLERYGQFLFEVGIRKTADVLKALAPRLDAIYQFGDDEFLMVLPETDPAAASDLANIIQTELSASIGHTRMASHPITLSIGIGTSDASMKGPSDLLLQTRRALDSATQSGGNRICVAHDERTLAFSYVLLPDGFLPVEPSLLEQNMSESVCWLRPGRILVVDDDWIALQLAENILKNQGYVVQVAETAEAARQALEQNTFDLVIMDVHLGDDNGLDAVAEFRERNLCPQASIIVATVDQNRATVLKAIGTGIEGYLLKPLRPSLLVEKVSNLVPLKCEGHERRIHPRFDIDKVISAQPLDAQFRPTGQRFKVQGVDISASGARLSHPVRVSSEFLMLWVPNHLDQQMEVFMQVLWCRSAGNGNGYDLGGRFVTPLTLSG